jgi:3-oxoacyl-[acyl-carrier-protein] synthase III
VNHARIVGTGSYLPQRVVTNRDLEQWVDTSDAWIRERTGIEQRHMAAEGETCSDLAYHAAVKALEAAGVAATELDLIIVGTTTPDHVFPSTACVVQHRLGANGCAAFDVQAVCSGFVYALSIADQFIRSGQAKRALVIGAETMSRVVNWQDRRTCVLFGDGAGAVVLQADSQPGIVATHLHANGAHKELLYVPWGISQGYAALNDESCWLKMEGSEVFKVAVSTLEAIVDETLEKNHIEKSQIDWLVPHQANVRIIAATARKLRLPMDRVVLTVAHHGNTSAASIPLALDVAVRDGRIRRGQLLLLESFGGGFTWGSALIKF